MASPASSRGYPVNFVRQPPKEMPAECPICLHVLCRPKVVSCCGHSFCAVCIGWGASDHKPCPLCGQQFTLTDNKWLERTLNDYDVYCPHQKKGCEWTGELGQPKHHLNQNTIPAEGCQFQDIACGLCQVYYERWLMADHVSNECPDWDIDSEYHYAGCVIKKPKQQLEQHIKDSVSLYLSLVSDHMLNNFSLKEKYIYNLSLKEKEVCELKYELSQNKKSHW